MIKYILTIALLFHFSIAYTQNKIEWSKEYKLKKEDYLAEAPNSGKQQTILSSFTIGFQVANYSLITSRNLNRTVSCYFQKDASYIDNGDPSSTSELIRYQQLLFDLYELSARNLRKKFFVERKRLLWEGSTVLYEEVTSEQTRLIAKVDRETEHGNNLTKLAEWEATIAEELKRLSDFSKDGRPKREKKKKKRTKK
ncbi:hypothetical protein [Marinifilum sp.]|uniref:hypothetical protein n=1 Tax=Marinifilum sp. TaxID=2033137 RepID=UPI003BA8CB78